MKKITLAFLLLTTPALAQQQSSPDPAFMQRAISSLQVQRNQAMDAAAINEAKAAGLADDLTKAQARIKELEKKPEEKK